jgi:hypothetical protein
LTAGSLSLIADASPARSPFPGTLTAAAAAWTGLGAFPSVVTSSSTEAASP